jgi:hypothetical protein
MATGSVEYPAEEEITVLTTFEPVAYRFEPPASLPLPLRVSEEEKQSTLGDVITTLREHEIKELDPQFGGGLKIVTASDTFEVGGPSFHVDVLRTFLDLSELHSGSG